MALPRMTARLHAFPRHRTASDSRAGSARVRTVESFHFLAHGTMSELAPLFGAEKERLWAPGWNPEFVNPQPARDEEGMVFIVDHGHHHAIWQNSEFDLTNGRMTYVYVIPDAMATLIRIRLAPAGENTRVDVTYVRTSLSPEADEQVRRMADGDRQSGPEWESQINEYLSKTKK